MAKKKMSAEERKEYKGGKYMGGPAEEKAEKKKGKRMFMGGSAVRDGVSNYGNQMGPAPRGGAAMPTANLPDMGIRDRRQKPPVMRPLPYKPGVTKPEVMPAAQSAGVPANAVTNPVPSTGKGAPGLDSLYAAGSRAQKFLGGSAPIIGAPAPIMEQRAVVPAPAMRGGGLARKGVGQALAKGGLVRGAGCAQRGVKKPRMV